MNLEIDKFTVMLIMHIFKMQDLLPMDGRLWQSRLRLQTNSLTPIRTPTPVAKILITHHL